MNTVMSHIFERNASHVKAGHQEQGNTTLLGTGHLLENEIKQIKMILIMSQLDRKC